MDDEERMYADNDNQLANHHALISMHISFFRQSKSSVRRLHIVVYLVNFHHCNILHGFFCSSLHAFISCAHILFERILMQFIAISTHTNKSLHGLS